MFAVLKPDGVYVEQLLLSLPAATSSQFPTRRFPLRIVQSVSLSHNPHESTGVNDGIFRIQSPVILMCRHRLIRGGDGQNSSPSVPVSVEYT